MHIEIAAFFLVLLLGCAAFVFSVFLLAWRFLGLLGRGLSRLFGVSCRGARGAHSSALLRQARSLRRGLTTMERVCPRPECRKVEHRPARYCSQCGCRFPD
jgi:hypothetical protein